jgi:hypothetical protein
MWKHIRTPTMDERASNKNQQKAKKADDSQQCDGCAIVKTSFVMVV